MQPGQVVRAGQKLGAVGLSYSFANGGYLAHLHFGIHASSNLVPGKVGEKVRLAGSDGVVRTGTTVGLDAGLATVRMPDDSTRRIPVEAGWVCGYVRPEEFSDELGVWRDPQQFLREAPQRGPAGR